MSNKIIVNGVDVIEELEKKEKLLELYRQYVRISNVPIHNFSINVFNRLVKIKNEIKELENETE